jgi:hypothetical protein
VSNLVVPECLAKVNAKTPDGSTVVMDLAFKVMDLSPWILSFALVGPSCKSDYIHVLNMLKGVSW